MTRAFLPRNLVFHRDGRLRHADAAGLRVGALVEYRLEGGRCRLTRQTAIAPQAANPPAIPRAKPSALADFPVHAIVGLGCGKRGRRVLQ
jgi:hypothetical protein